MFALSLQAWISIVGLGLSSCDEVAHFQSAAAVSVQASGFQDKTINQKWCEKNYVEAKDCEKWVADQLARKEARHMDNKNRREARLADDEARKEARKTEEKSHAAVTKADNEAPKAEKAVQVDASKDESSVGKGISTHSGAIMMIAEAASTSKTINMKWCQREHVEAQECEKWIADQLARQAARRADNKARKEAREADDEARKEARQADEKARKAAREEDDASRKSAREAADEAPKPTAQGQKTSVEGLDQHGMGDKAAPSPAVPMMLVLASGARNKTRDEKWCEKNYVAARDCEKWVADQLARHAARQADNKARKEAREADDEARKEARQADKEARKAARKEDDASQKSAHVAEKEPLKESVHDDQKSAEASEQPGMDNKAAPSPAVPMMLVLAPGARNKTKDEKWCEKNYVAARDCEKWVADQLARHAARQADNKARKEAREADDEARKEARQAEERVRKEAARKEDDASQKSAHVAEKEPLKQSAHGQKDSAEASEQPGMDDTAAPSPAVPMMLVADQLSRHASRQADNKARKEAREEDDEARKEARHADENARKEARAADNKARKEAREADENARKAERKEDDASQKSTQVAEREPVKQSADGQKKSAEGTEQPGMDDTAAPSPAVPMMLVADQLSRHAARQADNKARKEAREEDDEARKEARHADEKARKEARAADNKARKEARQADENARKPDHIPHKSAHEAHERSQNATAGESKLVKPQVNTLLSIEVFSAQPGLQTFTLLGLASLVLFTVPTIVRIVACRLRTRGSMSAPLLEESNLDV